MWKSQYENGKSGGHETIRGIGHAIKEFLKWLGHLIAGRL